MSAPSSSGRWKYGDAKVLSTMSSAPRAMRDLGHGGDVGDAHQRIGRRLDEHRARRRRHRVGDALRIARVDVAERQPEVLEDLVEQAERSAVHVLAADDVIAGAEQLHDRVEAPHAARERESVTPVLERRDVSLERFARRDSCRARTRTPCSARAPPARTSTSGRPAS